jgi:type VI protein secretion system component Hcp
VKKKTASKAKPKNLPAKGVSSKRAASVKGGRVEHSDISIVKWSDKASPKLYEA